MYWSQRGQLKINNCNQRVGDCFNLSFELAKDIQPVSIIGIFSFQASMVHLNLRALKC